MPNIRVRPVVVGVEPPQGLSAHIAANQVEPLDAIAAELDAALGTLRLSKLKIGRLLLKARALVPHGQWIPWVQARGLTDQTARNYAALAESQKFRDLPDDADPTYREAGLLADLTQPESTPEPAEPEPAQPHAEPTLAGRIAAWLKVTDETGVPDCQEQVKELGIDDPMATAQQALDLAAYLRDLHDALENLSGQPEGTTLAVAA